MQIDRLHHLQFPPDSKVGADDAERAPSLAPRNAPELPTLPLSSAVVVIKSESVEASTVEATVQDPATVSVYTATRPPGQAAAEADDAQVAQQQALDYKRALERSSNAPVQLKVDKDGVMVSRKPGTSAAVPVASPADFVTAAVQTMRDFANETERHKSLQNAADGAPGGQGVMGGGALRGLQQLTQRFKLFAQ